MEPGAGEKSSFARNALTVLLEGFFLVCVVALVWRLRTIIVWLLLAAMFAAALEPAVQYLSRRGVRRGWAVAIIAVVCAAASGLFGATLVPMIVQQGRELIARGPELIDRIWGSVPLTWARDELGLFDRVKSDLGSGRLAAPVFAFAANALHAFGALLTIFVMTIFMLLFGGGAFQQILAWIEPGRRARVATLVERMQRVVGHYLFGTFLVAVISGVTMAVTLAIVGVHYFLPLGFMVLVFGMVPFVGTSLAALILVLVTLGSSGVRDAVIVAVVYLVYQQVENHLLLPLVQRRTLRMNPLLISISLLIGATLAGLPGLVLALPLAGAAQVVMDEALAHRRARWGEDLGNTAAS